MSRVRYDWALLACFALGACDRRAPPGVEAEPRLELQAGGELPPPSEAPVAEGLGGPDDHLPFEPTGEKLASIAWRTWIYTDTGPNRTRLGYLRAGALVDARGPALVNAGCEGGWYRINPRGFVCVGKGATTDLSHPLVTHSSRRPTRGEGFPYTYAMSDDPPPHRYYRLPDSQALRELEGPHALDRGAAWLLRARETSLAERLGGLAEPPSFLAPPAVLEKPYGTKSPLRTRSAAGQVARGSGFALMHTFAWNSRAYGLSTELDVLPLDRLLLRPEQALEGVRIPPGHPPDVAFHVKGTLTVWKRSERGHFTPAFEQREKRGFLLTGQRGPDGMLETADGYWVAKDSVRRLELRQGFPSVAHGSRKWIDVSIQNQTLVAYVGKEAVYATLVSTGRGGMGDPERDQATVRGTFMIYEKSVSSTMDGDQDRADSYELSDVPFVQYFHKGFALHGAYWHDDFGRARSHGCINLSAKDSAWLFEWTDPPVPPDWHAVLNKERGTVVYVRR